MSAASSSHMRKGTRSCTECRRRKLRCSFATEYARKCRRCEERNLECLAQTSSTSTGTKLKAKDRIARLETQINQLSRALNAVESKVTHLPSSLDTPAESLPAPFVAEVSDNQDSDEDEDNTSERDDIIVQDDQHGIRGLFQNEWLDDINSKSSESRSSKALQVSDDADLAYARTKLQALIPDREDVLLLAGHVSGWSKFVAAMFPSFSLPPTEEQIIVSYDVMKEPTVDAWLLANWLLVLALCAQQMPQDMNSPGQLIQSMRKRYLFANAVADTAEATILSHDRLLGTVQGLEICPSFLRVMMTRGRIQKTWLCLRRLIAVAEFMGLPRLARIYEMQKHRNEQTDGEMYRCARLWVSISVIDRVISTLNGLPVATRLYALPTMPEALVTPEKQPLEHFIKLSNIAMEIQDLDEGRLSAIFPNQYSAVLKIDDDLNSLANTLPHNWQNEVGTSVSRSELINFLHHAFTLQLHVRFILRDDNSVEDYTHSKIIGLQACQKLTRLWRRLRDTLPFGFFLFAIMDIQAFTAIITMMLISATGYPGRAFTHVDREALAAQVEETVQIFEHNAQRPYSSKFLKRAVATLHNLRDVLDGNSLNRDSDSPSIVLKVPLLGKVHVRKGVDHLQPGAGRQHVTHTANNSRDMTKSVEAAMQPASYDALSWMIEEDGDMLFQDYLMMDDNEEWLQVGTVNSV